MIKYKMLFLVAISLLVYGQHAHAANIEAGKAKAMDLCADCHGDNGKGDSDTPAATGMTTDKFIAAMNLKTAVALRPER